MSWKNLSAFQLFAEYVEVGTNISFAEIVKHLSVRETIIQEYGQPGLAYQQKFCEIWEIKKEFPWFPKDKVFINKDFRKKITIAFKALEEKGLHKEIKTFDGCYVDRLSRGLKVKSLHAWAMAIDLNAAANPLGGPIKFSVAFLQTMKDCGIYCGAYWKRKDGMHFALFNG
ncbi:MAG: M15 family metallopeptidase [Chitinophagaceae bacterium]|nr:M15 family metallopeptidase [Chitinophagaceae bacterium]